MSSISTVLAITQFVMDGILNSQLSHNDDSLFTYYLLRWFISNPNQFSILWYVVLQMYIVLTLRYINTTNRRLLLQNGSLLQLLPQCPALMGGGCAAASYKPSVHMHILSKEGWLFEETYFPASQTCTLVPLVC